MSSRPTVLVVEDDSGVAEVIRAALPDHDVRIETSITGGLRALESAARLDLLITDVILPGGIGLAVVELAATLHPQARTILMSGHVDHELTRAGLTAKQLGEVLRKPFTLAELRCRVQTALAPHRGQGGS